MSKSKVSPSKERFNYSDVNKDSYAIQSFLSRYFQSKEFLFPDFDHDHLNSKFLSLTKFANDFQKETLDFKAWILNCYPMSFYFKNLVLNDKSTQILHFPNSLSKNSNRKAKSIYIGQTYSNMKSGYGFQISIHSEQQQSEDDIKFEVYEGFFENNIRHGKGKYFTNSTTTSKPNFYYGRFVNGQSFQKNTAFMVWANNDFYMGGVKSAFAKQGMGVLFITSKNKSLNYQNLVQIGIKKDPHFYQKVIISDWQQNTTKSQSFLNPSNTSQYLSSQTKLINHTQYYFGEAYVYYSSKSKTHICIKQGNGHLKYLNGDAYQGSFSFDKISGYGKYLWANQNYYIGQFMEGLKDGVGFWKDSTSHDEYEGQYRGNKRNGKGEYRWGNGNIYNGQFKNDLRQGFGKMIWASGQIYEGSWKDGLQNGFGSLYFLNENNQQFIRESQFVNGIEMEKGQNCNPLPLFTDRKRQSNLSKKIKQKSHLTSSRRKSQTFESSLRKYANASSLPKINEKTAFKFRNQSNFHIKTEPNELIDESMPKKVPKITAIAERRRSKERTLDYTETQKLPYHKPIGKTISKTQKIDRNRISSYCSGSLQKPNKKKLFCVDVALEENLPREQGEFNEKKYRKKVENVIEKAQEKNLTQGYRKINDILADSLLLPIKWRNIKRKSHNFILQRKQKMQSHDEQLE